MNHQSILIWINCYGAWDPEIRGPVETIGYDQYLTAVAQALSLFKERVADIYISGGMLDKKGRTECETTKPELLRRLIEVGFKPDTDMKTDEESLTSISIARKFVQVAHSQYPDAHPLLFVDEVRYENNLFTVDYFYKSLGIALIDARQFVVPLPRLDEHPHSTAEYQQKKLEHMKELGVEEVEKHEIAARRQKP